MSETNKTERKPWLPPRWFIRIAWFTHRRLYRLTGGRLGLWLPKSKGWGTLRLTAIGRRTGQERSVMVGYFEDGPNLVTMAMNGWGEGEPAWWLNLQENPDVRVDLADGRRHVTGRLATGDERERLWIRWRELDKNLDSYAARRSTQTAVVILEPRPHASAQPSCVSVAPQPSSRHDERDRDQGHADVEDAVTSYPAMAWDCMEK